MINTIIFDFDGTIANTLEAGMAIVNSLADKFGYKKLLPEDIKHLQGQLPREILREVGISLWKLPLVARAVRKGLTGQMSTIKFYPGIENLLRHLKMQNIHMAILTTGSLENVQIFLRQNRAEDLFDFVYAESNLFGKGRILKKMLKKNRIDPATVIYIGDEIRDIDAARQAGVKVAAVTWGVNSKVSLEGQHPDYLAETSEQLLRIFP